MIHSCSKMPIKWLTFSKLRSSLVSLKREKADPLNTKIISFPEADLGTHTSTKIFYIANDSIDICSFYDEGEASS